jgi:hypothetical protein
VAGNVSVCSDWRRPTSSAFTWADFHRASDVIKVGEEYIEPFVPKTKSHLLFFADTCRVPLRRR